jgi:hypothetical protein
MNAPESEPVISRSEVVASILNLADIAAETRRTRAILEESDEEEAD